MRNKVKKGISIILVMLMVFGGLNGLFVGGGKAYAANPVSFAGGDGLSEATAFQIATADQLNEVRNNLDVAGRYFKLTSDIDLASYANWQPIGNDNSRFNGIIDGNDHIITGLKINTSTEYVNGLFGVTAAGSTISNLNLKDVNITGTWLVGGLVAVNLGTISNSTVTGSVQGGDTVGGLVGQNEGGISYSYSEASVSGNQCIGGLLGRNLNGGTIGNSYATGSVNGTVDKIGGLVGANGLFDAAIVGGTISNSYATGEVSGIGANYVGGLVGSNYVGSISSSFYDKGTTGQSDSGKGIGKSTDDMLIQGTYTGWNFNSDWYMLPSKYPQLWAVTLTKGTNHGTTKLNGVVSGMQYSLDASHYNTVTSTTYDDIPVNAGDTIYVRVGNSPSYVKPLAVGLADIRGLTPPVLTADTSDNYTENEIVLTFADQAWGEAITGVTDGTTTLTGVDYIVSDGKITIHANLLIRGTHIITVTANGYDDAVVAQLVDLKFLGAGVGTLSNPYQIATADELNDVRNHLEKDKYFMLTEDIDLSNYTNVEDDSGWEQIGTESSPFKGNLDGDGHTINGLTIDRPEDVYGSASWGVGLFGFTGEGSSITNLKLQDVSIKSQWRVGGLVGQNSGTISNSFVTGSVEASDEVGGLVGQNSGTISDSYSAVIVSAIVYKNTLGGLVGHNYGTISNSYATGNVTGMYNIGGLVGVNDGTIRNSYATGIVSGDDAVGGLVGKHNNNNNIGKISNSYAMGIVSGDNAVGGLVGQNNDGSILHSFDGWGSTALTQGTNAGTTKLNNVANGMEYSVRGAVYIPITASVDNIVDKIPVNAGDTVTVRVYATPSSATTLTVSLTDITSAAAPTAALAVGTNAGTTKLTGVSDLMEYKLNNGSYNAITGTFVDNISVSATNAISVRVKETAEQPASNEQTLTVGLTDIKPAAAPTTALAVGTNAGTTKLSGVTSAMEYSVNSAGYLPITGTFVDNISVSATNAISVRVKETAEQPASNEQTLTVGLTDIKPAAAPTTAALAVGTMAGTTKLTGVTSVMEYKVNSGSYIPITGTSVDKISVNATDTLSVRVAATALQPASLNQTLTVGLADIKPISTNTESTGGDGGGSTPTAVPTATPAPTVILTATPSPSAIPAPTPTPKPFYNEKVNIDVIKALVEKANAAPEVKFKDVPANAPNVKAIELATKLGIIKGYTDGSFHANATVTRAEFATMLVKALGLTSEGDSSFKDTKGHWAADAIATLKASGIINGYLDGTFKPNQTISRAEIVAMLSKVMNTTLVKDAKFKDVSGNWAEAEIDTLSDMGIVKGATDGSFKPNANATRSESLLMILRMLNVSLGLSLDIE